MLREEIERLLAICRDRQHEANITDTEFRELCLEESELIALLERC
jgi:hypothetical protein